MNPLPKVGDIVRLRAGNALYRVLAMYSRGSMLVAEIALPNGQSYAKPAAELVIVDPERAVGTAWADTFPTRPRTVFQEDAVKLAEATLEEAQTKLRVARAQAEAVKQAQAAADKAAAAKQKVLDRLGYQLALAHATVGLLRVICAATNEQSFIEPEEVFATYRKDLNPLAKTYGYHLVLVGDNKKAVLSKL